MTSTPTATKTQTYDVMVSHEAWFLYETENAPYPNEETDVELYLSCVEVEDKAGNQVALKEFETPVDPIPSEWKALGGFAKMIDVTDIYQLELEAAPDFNAKDAWIGFGQIKLNGETHYAEDTEENPYGYSIIEELTKD